MHKCYSVRSHFAVVRAWRLWRNLPQKNDYSHCGRLLRYIKYHCQNNKCGISVLALLVVTDKCVGSSRSRSQLLLSWVIYTSHVWNKDAPGKWVSALDRESGVGFGYEFIGIGISSSMSYLTRWSHGRVVWAKIQAVGALPQQGPHSLDFCTWITGTRGSVWVSTVRVSFLTRRSGSQSQSREHVSGRVS